MTKTKFLMTVGLSVLAMSAMAAESPVVGDLQPAGGKTDYENYQRVTAVIDQNDPQAASRLLPTVNKKTDVSEQRVLPTVNKRTAVVIVRGWDPEKKIAMEARVKEITDKDENIASAEVDPDKIEVQYRRPAKLFGFIPVAYYHAFTVDGKGNIAQGHPWWLMFAKDDADAFGNDVDHIFQHNQSDLRWIKAPTDIEQQTQRFSALTDILKTRHDASQQAVGNTK